MAIGANDLITLKGNYIHHTSGRSPKLGGNTLLHAVNNLWAENTGHAFDNEAGSKVLAEGNVFQNVKTTLLANKGNFFAPAGTSLAKCATNLKHTCAANSYTTAATLPGTDTSVLTSFAGKSVATVAAANAATIKSKAGVGKI